MLDWRYLVDKRPTLIKSDSFSFRFHHMRISSLFCRYEILCCQASVKSRWNKYGFHTCMSMNEDNKIIAHSPTVLFTYLVWCLPSFLCSKVNIPAPGMVNGQKFDVDIHMNIQSCQIISMLHLASYKQKRHEYNQHFKLENSSLQ